MYRVVKANGNDANIIIQNTETKSNLIIGRFSYDIKKILEDAGYSFPPSYEAWTFEVNSETAKSLASKAMRMKKPIRDQRKKPEENKKSDKQVVDVFDMIFGIEEEEVI